MVGNKCSKIRDLLTSIREDSGLNFNEQIRTPTKESDAMIRFTINNKSLWHYLGQCGHTAKNKVIPRDILSLRKEALQKLFDAMVLGDGTLDSRPNRKSGSFYSTSISLIDDFQEICLKLGVKTKSGLHKPQDGNRNARYRVSFSLDCTEVGIDISGNRSIEQYAGMVYCYHVPNHLFVTRRNGCVTIQGNTDTTINKNRVNTCTRLHMILTSFWNDLVTYSLLKELGVDPYDVNSAVYLEFNDIDTEEQRARETHSIQKWTANGITHPELRLELGEKPLEDDDGWQGLHMNVVGLATAEMGQQAEASKIASQAAVANKVSPKNQTNPAGKVKPRVAKND
jgi:hypothetical protein